MTGIYNIPIIEKINMSTAPIAAYFGHKSGTSYGIPTSYMAHHFNPNYFSYANYTYTAKKACTVIITPILNPTNNPNSGSSNTGTYQILKNGTSIGSATSPSNITTTLAVGDTLQYQCKGSTNGYIAGGMVIKLST